MKEQELNAMMSVVSDPIENVYKIDSYKDLAEIQRIIRIFDISEEQHNRHVMFSIDSLATSISFDFLKISVTFSAFSC